MKKNVNNYKIFNAKDLLNFEKKGSKIIIGKFDCRNDSDSLFEFYSNDILFKDFQVLGGNFGSCIFKNCIFKNCLFEGCKFNISDFEKCDFLNCNFINCTIENLNFKKSNNNEISFGNYNESEFFPGEKIKYQI